MKRMTLGFSTASALSGGFFLVVAFVLLRQNFLFGDHVFDMGIFNQGMWLLSRFEEPFVSLRGLHLFADHSSYVMVLFTPLYWIWPDARVLLLVTAAALASGGILLYVIARAHELTQIHSVILAAAYLFNPVVLWQAWEDFHPEIVAVPCMLGAYLLARSPRPWLALIPLFILLSAKEDAAFVVVPLGIYFASSQRTRWLGLAGAFTGVIVFVVNFVWLLPHFSPTGALIYTNRYEALGGSLTEILTNLFQDPSVILGAVFDADAASYLGWTVLPLALSLLAPDVLAIGVPITVLNLASSFQLQGEPRRHYTIYFITIVALAAVVGAQRLCRWVPNRRFATIAIGAMVLAAVVTQPIYGPRINWKGQVSSGQASEVASTLEMIPDDAVVAADTFLAVRLSNRREVYRLPTPWVRQDWGTADQPPLPLTETIEWVAVFKNQIDSSDDIRAVIDELRSNQTFNVAYEDDLLLIFKRFS